MIELISPTRCIGCGLCVRVCPTNVFDGTTGQVPVIARQSDCQTCYMCEAYCPVDAMYVDPHADTPITVSEDELADSGRLGSWRTIGWGKGRTKLAAIDTTSLLHRIAPARDNGS